MKRRGVERAVVNTQTTNEVALTLYQSLGFRLEPVGLSVLATELPPCQPPDAGFGEGRSGPAVTPSPG
jgi:hypothetical protein